MKIAFFGTHGTGKTTLAHELIMGLKKKGADAGFLGEVARKCPFPINEDTTKKSQIWIILNQIIGELEAEGKYKFLICDRSVLDGYCYYIRKFGRKEAIEKLVKEHLKTYDSLIRVPIRKGFLKKDKIRSVNEKFQAEIDNQFDKMLKILKVDYINLNEKEENPCREIILKILGDLENA